MKPMRHERFGTSTAAVTPRRLVWQRRILMGMRCELPRFSGLILYDEQGRRLHLSTLGRRNHLQGCLAGPGDEDRGGEQQKFVGARIGAVCAGDRGDTGVPGSDEEDRKAAPRCSWAARKRIKRSCACWGSWRLGIEGTKGLRAATTLGGGEVAPWCGSRPGKGEKQR